MPKYEKTCLDNQHIFIQLAFDTFGFLANEDVGLLNQVQWVMNSNVMIHRSIDAVFKDWFTQFKNACGAACCTFALCLDVNTSYLSNH